MNEYKRLVAEFVSFKSISTDPSFSLEMKKTADWLHRLFEQNKFSVEQLIAPDTNPVVFASYHISDDLETVLVYGHYDVQPAEEWTHDPFIVREENDRLYARGIIDNKGQVLVHIFSVIELIKSGNLTYNIKFLIEGNEETGSPYLANLIEQHKDKLTADYIIVSDGEVLGENPTMDVSLRGGGNVKMTLRTAPNNVHSGIYGGALPNAAQEVSSFLAKLFSPHNQVLLPGFYDDVDPITNADRENNKLVAQYDDPLATSGVKQLLCEPGIDYYTQTGLRPTIEISGIQSGYTGEGFNNIIPAAAEVRLNFRFVASQNSQKIIESFKAFARQQIPSYVDLTIENTDANDAFRVPVDTPMAQHIILLLEESYGKEVLFHYVGGSIPIIGDFKRILGIDTLMIPLANSDCNMHGIDENFRMDLAEKALAFSKSFFSK